MNDWLSQAAALPLAFSQVREDPRLDLEVCAGLPKNATVVMIASGGDTAVCLSRLPLGRLIAVDMNAAQLALTRCKLELARGASRNERLEWLGHSELDFNVRAKRIRSTLDTLGLHPDSLGPLSKVAALGPDFAGRYEVLFAALNRSLASVRAEIQRLLEVRAPVSLRDVSYFDSAFAEIMSLPNLVALFGSDATQNPRKPFAKHFASRVRCAFAASAPAHNPFLWQMLAGKFPPGVAWDWIDSDAPMLIEPEFVHGMMRDALDELPARTVDFLHLSNILDWLSPADARAVLTSVVRVLKPGGRVLLRQLNSSLEIVALDSAIQWDRELGRAMEVRDRSFFYPEIHIGRCP